VADSAAAAAALSRSVREKKREREREIETLTARDLSRRARLSSSLLAAMRAPAGAFDGRAHS
jgi:putative exporter of polyketide antibiotics